MTEYKNEPAFPVYGNGKFEGWHGISIRDYFAAKVMQGNIASRLDDEKLNIETAAIWAYKVADAMIEARK